MTPSSVQEKRLKHLRGATSIKTLKHLALAALVIAGLLLPSALTRPQLASADHVGATPPCSVSEAHVDVVNGPPEGEGDNPVNYYVTNYMYKLTCDQGFIQGFIPAYPSGTEVWVTGVYSANPDTPDDNTIELLSSPDGTTLAFTGWGCAHDPWISPSLESCFYTLPDRKYTGSSDSAPFSTQDVNVRLTLAQLQYTAYIANQAEAAKQAEAARQAAAKKAAALAAVEVTSVTASGPGCRAACYGLGTPATEVTSVTAAGPGCGAACYGLGGPPAGEVTSVTAAGCAACSVLGQTPTPTPAHLAIAPAPAIAPWPQLSTSSAQGEAVRSLQYLLQQSGAALTVDGSFGPATDAAVRAFQKAQGITADGTGIVGQQTWLALIVTVQQGSKGAAVQAVQSQLNARGGAVKLDVDGDFGSKTDAAVKTYQQAHPGLNANGQVGPQTWQSLLAGS